MKLFDLLKKHQRPASPTPAYTMVPAGGFSIQGIPGSPEWTRTLRAELTRACGPVCRHGFPLKVEFSFQFRRPNDLPVETAFVPYSGSWQMGKLIQEALVSIWSSGFVTSMSQIFAVQASSFFAPAGAPAGTILRMDWVVPNDELGKLDQVPERG